MGGLLLQLAIILAAARVGGSVFRRLGQPRVCGEIAAGLALGPSLVGGLFPGTFAIIFPLESASTFRSLSEVGLVLLLFFVGLDLPLEEIRVRKRAAFTISLAGMVVPFVLGLALAEVLRRALAIQTEPVSFRLFVGTAVSITAIPTLARILDDLNLQGTRIAALTTTAAALDDVAGWTLLAAVTALVHTQFSVVGTILRLAGTVLFASLMIAVVRPIVQKRCARAGDPALLEGGGPMTAALVVMLLGGATTSALGLSGIFGAFLAGIALGGDRRLREALNARLRPMVLAMFLPVFFAYTGLRADVGSIDGLVPWLLCGVVIVVAIVGKIGGCGLAAATQGLSRSDAWSIGILMNTRGLMELVVVNIGLDLGVIPHSVFFMLVMMAVVTTYMTSPLVRRVLRHSEFAPLFSRRTHAEPTWPAPHHQAGT
jgi:Kef-type K+ transport system membrane component KefB